MENNEKTFPELWGGLTKGQRQQITRRLIAEGYALSFCTITNWGSGKTQPRAHVLCAGIAKIVGEYLGTTLDPDTLFPVR